MFNSLQIKFLIFIAVVFVIGVGFAILISRQMKVVGQKALIAKERHKAYENQLAAKHQEDPNPSGAEHADHKEVSGE
ncbi:MAG: hypothetical protein NTV45_07040 [Firmicutes bacterium]|nr:hypothetical protein [Bacillota bacterium]